MTTRPTFPFRGATGAAASPRCGSLRPITHRDSPVPLATNASPRQLLGPEDGSSPRQAQSKGIMTGAHEAGIVATLDRRSPGHGANAIRVVVLVLVGSRLWTNRCSRATG